MGLTKQYLRFVPGPIFGIIGTSSGKVLFSNIAEHIGDHVAVSACENVVIWNCRTDEKVLTLYGEKSAVSTINQEFNKRQLAAGYADGVIRIFDLTTGNCIVSFSGHKSAVSCLSYDNDGFRLVSGGMDTDIVIWDVLNEAGMFRLKGHKNVVTQCKFLKQKNILISCSKDSLVKFWDLDSQHCFKTIAGYDNEIWDCAVLHDSQLFVGKYDKDIDILDLSFLQSLDKDQNMSKKLKSQDQEENDDGDDDDFFKYMDVLKIPTTKNDAVEKRKFSFNVDKTEKLFGYHTYSKILQLFKIMSIEETKKILLKRKRKERKRLESEGKVDKKSEGNVANDIISMSDRLNSFKPMEFFHVISSFSTHITKGSIAKVVVLFINNSISLYELDIDQKHAEPTLQHSILFPGHRTDTRTLTFSSDSLNILSASADCVKIWNRESQKCITTLECEYALASLFAPGNKHCLIGTKSGKIQIFDLAANILLDDIKAHDGSVSCMCMSPDQHGLASGGRDKNVKFWDFELIRDENFSCTKKRLNISAKRILKMDDEVLSVKYSPNNRLLAVALLDCTVKVFFVDTLKFNFSLYGHKLPVFSMDVSYDSSLIATGSADRNVKIWSLEFGCCNKSIFAHDEGIFCVQFLPKTHMFFTSGKDKKIKQWDADNFQKIITLEGHQHSVYSLSISPDGTTVVSSSHDKSLRLWEKTSEPLVLEEEQEMEREAEIDNAVASKEDVVVPGEVNKDVSLAGRTNVEVVKSVDRLVESIDIYLEEILKIEDHEQKCKIAGKELPFPDAHPLLKAFSTTCPTRFMLEVLRRVKSSDLEEMLLLLPFNYASQLLEILIIFLNKKWQTELSCRCLMFLIRIHFGQISASQKLYPLLDKLQGDVVSEVTEVRDIFGFNMAALTFAKMKVNSTEEECLFVDASERNQQRKKRRKHKKLVPMLKSS